MEDDKEQKKSEPEKPRRVAWDDLRAMTPIEPHTDFSKPPIGYVLDDDGNYPESIREVL